MTLSEIRTRVRDLLNEATAWFWTDGQLNRLINETERDIAARIPCLEHIDTSMTTADTREVAYSGNKVVAVEYVGASSSLGLTKILPHETGRKDLGHITPVSWFQTGTSVGIAPLPSSAYTLNLYVADYPSAEMSGDGDSPEIPEALHNLIVLGAFARALDGADMRDVAAYIEALYEAELDFEQFDLYTFIPDSREVNAYPER